MERDEIIIGRAEQGCDEGCLGSGRGKGKIEREARAKPRGRVIRIN